MEMKKIITLALVLVMAFSLFAQGGAETAASAPKEITLQWWTWDPLMIEENKAIIADYEASHPGIKIENTIIDTNEYWTKIGIQAQQKKLPDVYTMSSGYLEEWGESGLMLNLDDLVKKDSALFATEFYQPIWDLTKSIGNTDHYYAIPFALVNTTLFYNKDAFDKAGIAYPTDDWTWDQFKEAAKALTIDKDGDGTIDQYGFRFYGRYAHIEPWVFANGGTLIDYSTHRFAPDAKALEAIKMLTDMVLVDKSAPSQKDMSALKNEQVFINGITAMWVDGGWNMDKLNKSNLPFEFGMVRVPQGPSGERVTFAWPDSYAIAPNTKYPAEAYEFAKYVAGKGLSLDQFMQGKIPAYKGLTESPDFTKVPGHEADMELLVDMASDPMTTSYTKGWSEWRGYGASDSMGFNGAIDQIINGTMSFDEGLAAAQKGVDKVLSRFYK
jgi:ABC-type sugar transport system, periplasmic component